jgi:flagellar assembly factor FliW
MESSLYPQRKLHNSSKMLVSTEFEMDVKTSRFGVIAVDESRIIDFPEGLLGFPQCRQFALIQAGEGNYFFWLQSMEEEGLAFVVTDPTIFYRDYIVPLREETIEAIDLKDVAASQAFVICNKVGEQLTGNLLGPIVVNVANRRAVQIVLTDKKYTTRQALLQLQNQDAPIAACA